MNRFEKDSNFEEVLKEYGIEWGKYYCPSEDMSFSSSGSTGNTYGYAHSRTRCTYLELKGIMVTELLEREKFLQIGIISAEKQIYDVIINDHFVGYEGRSDKNLFTALQKACNSIDWSK